MLIVFRGRFIGVILTGKQLDDPTIMVVKMKILLPMACLGIQKYFTCFSIVSIPDIGSPEGLAIDWVSRNIYWTDSTKDTIEVANLETKLRRTLFDTQLVNPRGIAVHPQRG